MAKNPKKPRKIESIGKTSNKNKASLIYGTYGEWPWLLRSRPDQVRHAIMRRGPPGGIITERANFCVMRANICPRANTRRAQNAQSTPKCPHVRRCAKAGTAQNRHPRYSPRCCHKSSTRCFTAGSIAIVVPHSRVVSPGHLLVASIPILLPKPLTGEAKSR